MRISDHSHHVLEAPAGTRAFQPVRLIDFGVGLLSQRLEVSNIEELLDCLLVAVRLLDSKYPLDGLIGPRLEPFLPLLVEHLLELVVKAGLCILSWVSVLLRWLADSSWIGRISGRFSGRWC